MTHSMKNESSIQIARPNRTVPLIKLPHLDNPLWIVILGAFSMFSYIGASAKLYGVGFPLDDAWIHQTYARSLALQGEWAFMPGQLSAGSTSPLWTILLMPGYWVGLAPLWWSWILGLGALVGIGVVAKSITMNYVVEKPSCGLWVGSFMVFEWHLVWAAVSGMETLLFSLIVMIALGWIIIRRGRWLRLGLIVGLSLWVRPDGLTLLGPALFAAILGEDGWKSRLTTVVRFMIGLLLIALPYLLFNLALSGELWPNTFFAKQAEYAVHREFPLTVRFFQQLSLPLVGSGLLLLPGYVLFIWRAVTRRDLVSLSAAIWPPGFLLLYALRLPVLYQHGRYAIPAMAGYFLIAMIGMTGWVRLRDLMSWRRILGRAWIFAMIVVTLAFWGLGASAFAKDVAVIESEMVAAAKWVAENTEAEALIAAHDIGALGFFGNRRILDLAGLISPEVISIIRDESRLEGYLDEKGVEYLVCFPGWYPELTQKAKLIYSTEGLFSLAQGGENMQVFQWR